MNNIKQIANESMLASGLIIVSLVTALVFFDWAYNTLYDKKQIENRGHQYYAKKQYNKAYQDFNRAAELNARAPGIDKQKISESYRYAATAAYADLDFTQASIMIVKSLTYDRGNTAAIELIKRMINHKQIDTAQIEQLDSLVWDRIHAGQNDLQQIENTGHYYYAQKQYAQAFHYFSQAARLNARNTGVNKKKLSENYRFAATAAYANLDFTQAAAMVLKSLAYNPKNTVAIALIKRMLKHKQMDSAQIADLDQDLRGKIYN